MATLTNAGITFGSNVQNDVALGYSGQSWNVLNGSRSLGTTYTNSTSNPIFVLIAANVTVNRGYIYVTINGTNYTSGWQLFSNAIPVAFMVQPGATYQVSGNIALPTSPSWSELR